MNRNWRCRIRGYYNLNSHKNRRIFGSASMIQKLPKFSTEEVRDEENLGASVRLSTLPVSLDRELYGWWVVVNGTI